MIFSNIDAIVRRTLLERGLPIHYYAEYLFHATACLRELSFDSLQIVNTKRLPVNSYFAVDLPADYVDDVAVSVPIANFLQPVTKHYGLTPLRAKDSSGAYIPYSDQDTTTGMDYFATGFPWFWNVNSYGEPTGGYYGVGGGAKSNGYMVVKERRQIQLTESFTSDEIVLQYISDGQSADAASMVEVAAISSIQAWINWKSTPFASNDFAPEARHFYNQKRTLRARLNGLTPTDIKNIIRKTYRATAKN